MDALITFIRNAFQPDFCAPLFRQRLSTTRDDEYLLQNYVEDVGYLSVLCFEDVPSLVSIAVESDAPASEIWDRTEPDASNQIAALFFAGGRTMSKGATWSLRLRSDAFVKVRFVLFDDELVVPVVSVADTLDRGRQRVRYLIGDCSTGDFIEIFGVGDARQFSIDAKGTHVDFDDALAVVARYFPTQCLRHWRILHR